MRPAQIVAAAADFDVPVNSAIDMRLVYLLGVAEQWKHYMAMRTNVIPAIPLGEVNRQIEVIHRYETDPLPKDGDVTDEMIERARQFPIQNLVGFDRGDKALAWCHADKQPSLHFYRARNMAWCWPCNKGYNPISVLMLRDGMSFIDAVKNLQ